VALSITDIKSGVTILINSQVYIVLDAQHIKPGKGAAFVRAKVRNMKTSNVQEVTYRGDDKIEQAFVEERRLQYQYNSGDMYHFMDQENFEDIAIPSEAIGDKAKFLKDNIDLTGLFYNGETLTVSLPNAVEYRIIHTEPGVRGDTAKGTTKPAEIETGATIQVPLFVNEGDVIKVDTRSGEYLERVVR
jgi:elongation factor P